MKSKNKDIQVTFHYKEGKGDRLTKILQEAILIFIERQVCHVHTNK